MNKLLSSGPTARAPKYQCLRYINHTKSCPTYWHHIHLITSPFFNHLHLETPHMPFHIITRLTLNIENTSPMNSTAQLPEPRAPAHQLERRKSPGLCANQRASSWRGYLMSYITPCATMTTRLLMTFYK